ncbi:MAG: GNAT family N-acetyltransferase [Deltaproteobacteria bacterium]|nr:GNAT family N-acetyltransferase [Deltaproteobacteria bacterium]
MNTGDFEFIAFDSRIVDRAVFDCGVPVLDDYFKTKLNQDIKNGATRCFVAVEKQKKSNPRRPFGFATLTAGSISKAEIPDETKIKVRNYSQIGVILLGRLAVDRSVHGIGLGQGLLMEAIYRVYLATSQLGIGCRALVVDAKDASAEAFYKKYGFLDLQTKAFPKKLLLPIESIVELFRAK